MAATKLKTRNLFRELMEGVSAMRAAQRFADDWRKALEVVPTEIVASPPHGRRLCPEELSLMIDDAIADVPRAE